MRRVTYERRLAERLQAIECASVRCGCSYGYAQVENRVSIHDLHATMLNQLGIDHTKLTYRYAGRDFRLTDVYGELVKDILT